MHPHTAGASHRVRQDSNTVGVISLRRFAGDSIPDRKTFNEASGSHVARQIPPIRSDPVGAGGAVDAEPELH